MNNTYGIIRPSVIDINNDVDIWYHYRPTRVSEDASFKDFKRLEPSEVFKCATVDGGDLPEGIADTNLPGMYNLSLPASYFSKKGFYTIYIKPKEYIFSIYDVGALAAYPDVVGIVLNMNQVGGNPAMFANDNLVGYRVEYFDMENGKLARQPYYRIITSNTKASPVSQNLTSANTNSNGYRYNDSGNLVFMTLTPSTSPSFKASSTPYIGAPNQTISITNTKFDPVCLEVEMCSVDFDTLDVSINGNQIRSLDNSIVSIYNGNNEIYKQFEHYTVKDNYNTRDMYEVKKDRRGNIDFSADADALFNVEE